ncbi:MAG: hypothetical protein WCC27_00735 [Acidobacteriaceae bacterium]
MKRTNKIPQIPDIPAEIDFRGGERGRYAKRFGEGFRIVILKKKPKRKKA